MVRGVFVMDFMKKIEKMTDKLFLEGHIFSKGWEKYISTLQDRLSSGFELSPTERKQLMEFIARAYDKLGDKAEAFAWRAKALAEHINEIIPEAMSAAEAEFVVFNEDKYK